MRLLDEYRAGVLVALMTLWVPGSSWAQQAPVRGPGQVPSCVASLEQAAENVAHCMRVVMYPRDLSEAGKPQVSAAAAALLCRGARTLEAGRGLSDCVLRLLYERGGMGSRREDVEGEAAAVACRYAQDKVAAEQVEDCMRRLMYERGGLGARRTEVSAMAAAQACQSVVAPVPLPWVLAPVCVPPGGVAASELLEECVRRLMYRREGLGERRQQVSAEAALFACQGALSP